MLRRRIIAEQDPARRLHIVHDAVNAVRTSNGLAPVPLGAIEDIDDASTGADWASKFALRASRLAEGDDLLRQAPTDHDPQP